MRSPISLHGIVLTLLITRTKLPHQCPFRLVCNSVDGSFHVREYLIVTASSAICYLRTINHKYQNLTRLQKASTPLVFMKQRDSGTFSFIKR
jgi:hypothetical protein